MTRLTRLILILAGIATGVCLAVIPMSAGPVAALGIWFASLAFAVVVAVVIEGLLWRCDASYERWRRS